MSTSLIPVLSAFLLTLVAHISARLLAKKLTGVPTVVTAIILVIALLFVFNWQFDNYYSIASPIFDRLLGYVTVLLAIPLASINFKGLPLKKLFWIVLIATSVGALLPMGLAYTFALSQNTILAFATRSVTAPIGLSIAGIINSPLIMANLIISISGLLGAGFGKVILKNIEDDRAKGLAMGLVCHAFGTIEAWQISPTAGRYAAFGLAVNGLITALWVPVFISLII